MISEERSKSIFRFSLRYLGAELEGWGEGVSTALLSGGGKSSAPSRRGLVGEMIFPNEDSLEFELNQTDKVGTIARRVSNAQRTPKFNNELHHLSYKKTT